MSSTLYAFIDESGNPSNGDYYVVACCWCVSDRDSPEEVLRGSLDEIITGAEGMLHGDNSVNELKGSKLPTEVLIGLFENYIPHIGYDDPTIRSVHLPWNRSQPFMYSIHTLNPNLGNEILEDVFGDYDTSVRTLKTMSLASVLNPAIDGGWMNNQRINQISVTLDSDVWKRPAENLEKALDVLNHDFKITFNTNTSHSVPGLQIADIGAYCWARNMRKGDLGKCTSVIHRNRHSGN
jgi:hypothetical protein